MWEWTGFDDGDRNQTRTVRSVRANGHGNAVGTQWYYFTITSDLIHVERNGRPAYWIVRCY